MDNTIPLAVVQRYVEAYPQECAYIETLQNLLRSSADACSRKNFPAHITASALLLNDKRECLFVHHKALNKMLPPGGHLEPRDENPQDAALRELYEETGIPPHGVLPIEAFGNLPIDIDFHHIPARPEKAEPAHEHWDFMYAFTLSERLSAIQLDTSEVIDFAWILKRDWPEYIRERVRNLT